MGLVLRGGRFLVCLQTVLFSDSHGHSSLSITVLLDRTNIVQDELSCTSLSHILETAPGTLAPEVTA